MHEAPRLGVLFVHGIGDQVCGATLRDFGETIIGWLNRRSPEEPAVEVLEVSSIYSGSGQEPAWATVTNYCWSLIDHGSHLASFDDCVVRLVGELGRTAGIELACDDDDAKAARARRERRRRILAGTRWGALAGAVLLDRAVLCGRRRVGIRAHGELHGGRDARAWSDDRRRARVAPWI